MLAVRSSRCAAQGLIRHEVIRQNRASLATVKNALSEESRQDEVNTAKLAYAPRRAFFLRPWDGVTSMAQGLAILRAFELQYGKLRDVEFGRDFEVREVYLPIIWANFDNDLDFENIPVQETHIKLEVPTVPNPPPGDTSLADVQSLLFPFDKNTHPQTNPWARILESMKVEEGTEEPLMQTVDVKIGRGVSRSIRFTNFLRDPERRPNRAKLEEIGKAFVQWGGFATPARQRMPDPARGAYSQSESVPESVPSDSQPLSLPSLPHMRAARGRWSYLLPKAVQTHAQNEAVASHPEAGRQEHEPVSEKQGQRIGEEFTSVVETEAAQTVEPIPVVEEVEVVEEIEEDLPTPSTLARPSKRDKLLALARVQGARQGVPQKRSAAKQATERNLVAALAHEHAHTPLPEKVIPRDPEAEQKALKEEEEKKEAEDRQVKATILGRLQKLWGW